MKYYINDKGQRILIAEMPDAYLLNSYAKQNKRLQEIMKRLKDNPTLAVYISQEVNTIQLLINDLREEVRKRNLF